MTIEDIIPNCSIPVEVYVKEFYNWNRHSEEQKQLKSDINKNGGFIKTYEDDLGNKAFIMRSISIPVLPEDVRTNYTESTYNMFQQLIKKNFYFCAIQGTGKNFDELEFPNEIWLTIEDAIQGTIQILQDL